MKTFKIGGIATLVVVLVVVVVGAVAFADEAPDDGAAWPFNFGQKMHQAIANVLGISVDEYDAAIGTARDQVLDEALAEGHLTQEQADRIRERTEEGRGPWMEKRDLGRRGGFMAERSLVKVAADEMVMTVEDLVAELKDGKTIAEVAEEQGVDPQAIADAALAKLAERLAEAVENGRITQEQADEILNRAEESIQKQLYEPISFEGARRDRFPGGGRPGGFKGFPGQGES